MKILVKKFSLCHDGVNYSAGSVADLPDDVAADLIQHSPKEFAAVDAPATDETPATPAAPAASVENGLPPVDAEKLRKK
ncbi:hypothetical protein [Megasphaera sp.]|uniref:hypothetical protein n=1 Tax=Megasphaera sp. TaxID=2023260 RepID=UPI003FD7DEE9